MSNRRESSVRMGPIPATSITFRRPDNGGGANNNAAVDDCCVAVRDENERLQDEGDLQAAPWNNPPDMPLVLSPRIIRLTRQTRILVTSRARALSPAREESEQGSPRSRPASPAGSRTSRSGRAHRAPTRFSPSDFQRRLRGRSDSDASETSSVGSASSLARRRGRKRGATARTVSRKRNNTTISMSKVGQNEHVMDHNTLDTIVEQDSDDARLEESGHFGGGSFDDVQHLDDQPERTSPPLTVMNDEGRREPLRGQRVNDGERTSPLLQANNEGRREPLRGQRVNDGERTSPLLQANNEGRREPQRQVRQVRRNIAGNRAPTRQERAEERLLEQREVQMQRERQREGLRDNIRAQVEARRINMQQQPRQAAAHQDLQGVEGAEMALLRQFLTEKEMDAYGHFGQTVASMMRSLPPAVSGKAMVEIMQLLNTLTNDLEERENFMSRDTL